MRLTPTELRQAITKAYCDKNNTHKAQGAVMLDAVVAYIVAADLEKSEGLRSDIASAINRWSAENGSNTPDFLLAGFLTDCLAAFDRTVTAREQWYGRMPQAVPGELQPEGPFAGDPAPEGTASV